jgi:hypothetical protein
MPKTQWQVEKIADGRHYYARRTRDSVIVRVEREGDTTQYAEMEYPRAFGCDVSIAQAAVEVKDKDIKP